MTTYDTRGDYVLVVCPNPSVDSWIWLDDLRFQETNRMSREEHYPGGKGVHVAMALAELGQAVHLLCYWAGPTGQWIQSEVERRYLHLRCVGPTIEGWSRHCYTVRSEHEVDGTEVLGIGPTLTPEAIRDLYEVFEQEVKNATGVAMSGSWPPSAPDDGYAQLIRRAAKYQKAVFLDCTGPLLTHALAERPFCVHLNRAEATQRYAVDEVEEALSPLLADCHRAAITDGARGLWLAQEEQIVQAKCSPDRVLSAVGSGDCLVAGLVDGLVRDLDLLETARRGVACGAANCQHEELGMLKQKDVAALGQRAQVTTLNIPLKQN